MEGGDQLQIPPRGASVNNAGGSQLRGQHLISLDLNSLPYPESDDEESKEASG